KASANSLFDDAAVAQTFLADAGPARDVDRASRQRRCLLGQPEGVAGDACSFVARTPFRFREQRENILERHQAFLPLAPFALELASRDPGQLDKPPGRQFAGRSTLDRAEMRDDNGLPHDRAGMNRQKTVFHNGTLRSLRLLTD